MCFEFYNMGWQMLVNFIRQPMLKLKTHSGFHDLFLKFSMFNNIVVKEN